MSPQGSIIQSVPRNNQKLFAAAAGMHSAFQMSMSPPPLGGRDHVSMISKGRRNAYLQQQQARLSADPHFIEADLYRRSTPPMPIQYNNRDDLEYQLAAQMGDMTLEAMRERIQSNSVGDENFYRNFLDEVNELDIDDESDFYFGDDDDSIGKGTEETAVSEDDDQDDLVFDMDT